VEKKELHPRNRHKGHYDFPLLIKACPDLAKFVSTNKYGNFSVDFANPLAVKTLNKALLKLFYNVDWDIPEHYLCPPIPGRADYIHQLADLLALSNNGVIPRGPQIRVLDIGVGANCIYPLLGHKEYGWSFVGTDIDPQAIKIAKEIITQNHLSEFIEIHLQKTPSHILEGLFPDQPSFDISMCNPPFHSSAEEAKAGTTRKLRNLKLKTKSLNFGGKNNELWCPGGEVAFITRMINESPNFRCKWFTTLVSKSSNLPSIYRALDKIKPSLVKTIEMGQGQKQSRIVSWSF
jgi:23S rRNA (adenine1618-N6)-methyltransferase